MKKFLFCCQPSHSELCSVFSPALVFQLEQVTGFMGFEVWVSLFSMQRMI